MPVSKKLVAAAASAVVLVGGGTAVAVSTPGASAPTSVVATPAPAPVSPVTVSAHGLSSTVEVERLSVAAALVAAGVELQASDRVTPELGSPLAAGDTVTVSQVSSIDWTKKVTLAFETTNVNDPTLEKGTTKVRTEGVEGEKVETYRTTTVAGEVEGIALVGEQVTKEPVTKVVLVGTKAPAPVATAAPRTSEVTSRSSERTAAASSSSSSASTTAAPAPAAEEAAPAPSSGAGLDLSRAAMWDRIAQCESTGRWNINTGNGYYGGLQFNLGTWRSVNGTDFAAYPHQASREEQITVANRLYELRGLQPWGCRHAA